MLILLHQTVRSASLRSYHAPGNQGCGASDRGVENTDRTGDDIYCTSEVMKHCVCRQPLSLLPSSILAEQILSQCEKEGQMVSNSIKNTATRTILFGSASVTLRREVDLVHPQLSKLLKSVLYGYKHDSEIKNPMR